MIFKFCFIIFSIEKFAAKKLVHRKLVIKKFFELKIMIWSKIFIYNILVAHKVYLSGTQNHLSDAQSIYYWFTKYTYWFTNTYFLVHKDILLVHKYILIGSQRLNFENFFIIMWLSQFLIKLFECNWIYKFFIQSWKFSSHKPFKNIQ